MDCALAWKAQFLDLQTTISCSSYNTNNIILVVIQIILLLLLIIIKILLKSQFVSHISHMFIVDHKEKLKQCCYMSNNTLT